MVATSGAPLADDKTVTAFGGLMDVATIVTPNLPELKRLTMRRGPGRSRARTWSASTIARC